MKRYAWLIFLFLLSPFQPRAFARSAPQPAVLRYLSPPDQARFVQPGTSLILRLEGPIDRSTLSPTFFNLVGSSSGVHPGQVKLASDGQSVVFQPARPFTAGEQVSVEIRPGLGTQNGAIFGGLQTAFHVAPGNTDQAMAQKMLAAEEAEENPSPTTAAGDEPATPNTLTVTAKSYVTFPSDFPAYTVTVATPTSRQDALFMSPIPLMTGTSFLFMADESGSPLYWQRVPSTGKAFDFKKQPDGNLSYYGADFHFHEMDDSYAEVRTITATNGYLNPDFHDLQILPNGDALFMIYDYEPYDMSTVISGGLSSAYVVGLVIQEVDPNNVAVFQWRSWDYDMLITDTTEPLTGTVVDFIHGNALAIDPVDNNILLSSRHLSEITKIDHADGHIIWRLGGNHNEFTVVDGDGPFAYQHDIRQLANGDLTIFDNHNPAGPSRALEYQLDETNKVVTNTWQFENNPGQFGPFTGNNQRLPDGHRLIDWGFSYPNVTEVLTDGTKAFELTLAAPYFSYRSFRFPWSGIPTWSPTLVLTNTSQPTLYYSWNGATDVASYNIYAGNNQIPTVLLANRPRTGFEDHVALENLPPGYCAFRVQPVDRTGHPQLFSNTVYSLPYCPALLVPLFFR